MSKNTSPHFRRVRAFMQKARQSTPIRATVPDDATRLLRARLILEEAMETVEALGVSVRVAATDPEGHVVYSGLCLESKKIEPDVDNARLKEIIDGCCDSIVVVLGTMVSCGVPDLPAMEEVCNSNDSKFAEGYSLREDGKLQKSPSYTPADFSAAIAEDVLR
jgi:predicted HAD superfamily Cof-like phosphohydrolase